jgi:hypothetical protein
MKQHHIIDAEDGYVLVETISYKDQVFSKVIGTYKTLDLAEKTRIISILYEDGVPVNAASSGHIAAIGIGPDGEPPGKTAAIKKLLRRRKKPLS